MRMLELSIGADGGDVCFWRKMNLYIQIRFFLKVHYPADQEKDTPGSRMGVFKDRALQDTAFKDTAFGRNCLAGSAAPMRLISETGCPG